MLTQRLFIDSRSAPPPRRPVPPTKEGKEEAVVRAKRGRRATGGIPSVYQFDRSRGAPRRVVRISFRDTRPDPACGEGGLESFRLD